MVILRNVITGILLYLVSIQASYALVIKLGSPAPEGSPWDTALKRIASDWKKISSGKIIMKIYPGGIAGNEPDIIRKMRIGQLQAAIFTGVGLSYISPEILVLSMPMFIHTDKELDYILSKKSKILSGYLHKKGFALIAWSKSGWIHFFSKRPVIYPADMKKHFLAVAEGNNDMLQAWRSSGFQAVPLASNDILTGLQSGMVDAFYAPPIVAASFQWFGLAPNMCSLKIAPLVGGLVLNNRTWNQIPDKIKPQLLEAVKTTVMQLQMEIIILEKKAINTMKKNGLKINIIPKNAVLMWQKEAVTGYDKLTKKSASKNLFFDIKNILKEYRIKKIK